MVAGDDDEAKETLEEKGRKRFAGALNQGGCHSLLVRGLCKLDIGETTTTFICPVLVGQAFARY